MNLIADPAARLSFAGKRRNLRLAVAKCVAGTRWLIA
jgi:hypothetical protein